MKRMLIGATVDERNSGLDPVGPGSSGSPAAAAAPAAAATATGLDVLAWFRANPFAHCTTVACWWGAVAATGPHLLHYLAPVAGTGLVAGAGGRLIFGVVGFLATVPTLWRLHRRTGGWRLSGAVLLAFVVIFLLSTFLMGTIFEQDARADNPAGQPIQPDPEHLHG